MFATMILGPRRGRFHDETGRRLDTPREFQGHSVALQVRGLDELMIRQRDHGEPYRSCHHLFTDAWNFYFVVWMVRLQRWQCPTESLGHRARGGRIGCYQHYPIGRYCRDRGAHDESLVSRALHG